MNMIKLNILKKLFSWGLGKPMTFEDAPDFLGISYHALENLVYAGKIPFHVKPSNVYFFQNELSDWKKKNPLLIVWATNRDSWSQLA